MNKPDTNDDTIIMKNLAITGFVIVAVAAVLIVVSIYLAP